MNSQLTRVAFFTALSLCLTACGSVADHERTVGIGAEYATLGTSLTSLKEHVDASVAALGLLGTDGGASSAYQSIATAATNIGPAVDQIKNGLATSEQSGKNHFDSWSRQNATIQDAELRGRAGERQSELASLMGTTSTSITKALDLSDNYAQSLVDLQKYLNNDLSSVAIGNAADRIAKIRGEGIRFSAALDSATKDTVHFSSKIGN